jgi:DNA polymerase
MMRYQKSKRDLNRIHEEIRNCKKCRLHETRTNTVPGEGPIEAKAMICGQAPGRTEDKEGRPFVGRAGRVLNKALNSIKVAREDLFITSPIKCFPPKNRPPRSDELNTCRSYLDEQIQIIKPKIIVALGNYALQTLLNRKVAVSQVHGKPLKEKEFIVFPTFHPAAAMRFPKIDAQFERDFKSLKELLTELDLL